MEILFKAKRLDTGEWIEGYLFSDGIENSNRMFVGNILIEKNKENTCENWNITGYDFEEVDPKTICRYAGLIDKNGKKIFESDKLADKYGDTGIVKYGYENFGCCYDVYGFAVDGLEEWINEDVIVIGNIHDKENEK